MDRAGELPLGTPLPVLNAHAITVSIPKWAHFVGYQEGDPAVLQQLRTGYPRFVVHALITQLSDIFLKEKGREDEGCMLFPVSYYADECRAYLLAHSTPSIAPSDVRRETFSVGPKGSKDHADIHATFYPITALKLAKQFWQHTGFGLTSRCTQRCLEFLGAPATLPTSMYGSPRRQLPVDDAAATGSQESRSQRGDAVPFSASQAKAALRGRIADCLFYGDSRDPSHHVRGDDVFLYQTGMTAIWHAHQLLMALRPTMKFVCFGFPYTDTLKILEKWGPGCHFFGHDPKSNMQELEALLSSSSAPPIAALFCEIPSNPRLESPPLDKLRALADKYDFLIVVDDTIGSWVNVNVLPYVDIIVSSLSKYISGYATAMGGSLVLNPRMRYYQTLKAAQARRFEDVYFEEDIVEMEKNSRDFPARMRVVNANANVLCDFLRSRSLMATDPTHAPAVIKEIFYPKWVCRAEYDLCRVRARPSDGQAADDNFGGLFSLTFVSPRAAHAFLDALLCAKGPSLGTNFTLVCPYTVLAHYGERKWAADHGVDEDLVRVSVGIEDQADLLAWFEGALDEAENAAAGESTS